MTIDRRVLTSSMGAALLLGSGIALGQELRPIRIMVGISPGGLPDTVARVLASEFTEVLGETAVVENRPGAGGNIAARLVASSEPDGRTLLITGNNHSVNPVLLPNPGFDYEDDFAPVSMLVQANMMLVASPSLPASSVAEIIDLAKRSANGISFAVPPVGTPNQLGADLFAQLAGIEFSEIPYPGLGPALPDVMTGRVQLTIGSIPSVLPHVLKGSLKAIAVTRSVRSPLAPDVPTISEAGLDGFDVGAWICLLAPGKTPKSTVARLNADVRRVLMLEDVQRQFAKQGAEIDSDSPEQLRSFMTQETAKWASVLAHSRGAR